MPKSPYQNHSGRRCEGQPGTPESSDDQELSTHAPQAFKASLAKFRSSAAPHVPNIPSISMSPMSKRSSSRGSPQPWNSRWLLLCRHSELDKGFSPLTLQYQHSARASRRATPSQSNGNSPVMATLLPCHDRTAAVTV
ncbi:hypothetical protein HGRIS_006828 [Hohenbuehelia grisea]|uniref:Uncharacterized protein n=1 Tax=Hohenbuehelia grisea TaxID=104357 RepID=A0ABR3JAH1_9AGAR